MAIRMRLAPLAVAALLLLATVSVSAAAAAAAGCPASTAYSFEVDLNGVNQPWPHYWETTVGSDHARQVLRSDWRVAMENAHEDLGFQSVRFHGLFDDDMSVAFVNATGGFETSFFNVDQIYDYLLSIGVRPLVELGFMPSVLAANASETVFWYKGITSPPRSWEQWGAFVTAAAQHWVQRYGLAEVSQWHFEVWNEPNCGFWSGNQTSYFELYKTTALALKAVDASLQVGGPVTCQSQWIPEFLDFVSAAQLPIDFVSTHEYPTDIQPLRRNVMQEVVSKAVSQARGLPVFYTEYNDGLFADIGIPDGFYHDDSYAAAFIVKNIYDVQGMVPIFSWWCVSDIFEESPTTAWEFQNGYGLQTIHQVPKPSYRAFQLLHRTGNETLASSQTAGPTNSSVELFSTLRYNGDGTQTIHVLLSNFDIPTASPQPTNQSVCVTLAGLDASALLNATVERIDATHANAKAAWLQMGSPLYPTTAQIASMVTASTLVPAPIKPLPVGTDSIQLQTWVAPLGVAVIELTISA